MVHAFSITFQQLTSPRNKHPYNPNPVKHFRKSPFLNPPSPTPKRKHLLHNKSNLPKLRRPTRPINSPLPNRILINNIHPNPRSISIPILPMVNLKSPIQHRVPNMHTIRPTNTKEIIQHILRSSRQFRKYNFPNK